MRLSDELPLDPEIVAELEALDATLTGDPVDPHHAELAELALLLVADRPVPDAAAATRLDGLVLHRRFSEPTAVGSPARWFRRPAFASGLVAATAAVVAVVALSGGSVNPNPTGPLPSAGSSGSSGSTGSRPLEGLSPFGPDRSGPAHRAALGANGAAKSAAPTSAASTSGTSAGAGAATLSSPAPVPSGRKLVQSAQLQLLAPGSRIDQVAQELFNAIGALGGIVRSSNITQAGAGGNAFFSLSIPSGNLQPAMTRLSTLPHSTVASRTDATQDVTDQYGADRRRLADARALRTSLLRQLAGALTTTEVDSLQAQIRDAEASISSDEATLRGLGHRIGYSSVNVQISAGPAPASVAPKAAGGFTLGRAAHDAGRVLTVAAGVALIVLAALVPVGLLAALAAWIAVVIRHRRRERALDTA
jgi:hypothetical protein